MPIDEQGSGSQDWTIPDALSLDLRVTTKRRVSRRWQSQIDCIAERISGKAQPQIYRIFADCSLNWMFSPFYGAAEFFRTGPKCRLQSALARERSYDTSLRSFCE